LTKNIVKTQTDEQIYKRIGELGFLVEVAYAPLSRNPKVRREMGFRIKIKTKQAIKITIQLKTRKKERFKVERMDY
jgi:hypothetical protein